MTPRELQNHILRSEIDRLRAEVERLRQALDTIAGGHTDRFRGAPDIMAANTAFEFRSDMWTWAQVVAKSALSGQPAEGDK